MGWWGLQFIYHVPGWKVNLIHYGFVQFKASMEIDIKPLCNMVDMEAIYDKSCIANTHLIII